MRSNKINMVSTKGWDYTQDYKTVNNYYYIFTIENKPTVSSKYMSSLCNVDLLTHWRTHKHINLTFQEIKTIN